MMRLLKQALIPTLLIGLTLLAACASVWQWQRAAYHQALAMTASQQQGAHEELQIHNGQIVNSGLVKVSGRWLAKSTTYISPRIVDGQTGAWPVAIFELQLPTAQLLYVPVKLGWLAQPSPTQAPTINDLPQGAHELLAYVAQGLPKVFELSSMSYQHLGLWQNYNLHTHEQILNLELSPSVLVLVQSQINDVSAGHMQRDDARSREQIWQQRAQSNRGYAFQWLGIACVGLLGLFWLWKTRRKY